MTAFILSDAWMSVAVLFCSHGFRLGFVGDKWRDDVRPSFSERNCVCFSPKAHKSTDSLSPTNHADLYNLRVLDFAAKLKKRSSI